MAKYEWKIGDKLRFIDGNQGGPNYPVGTIFTANSDVCTDSGETRVYLLIDGCNSSDYFCKRFEKVIGKEGKKPKVIPKVLHIVLKDDCINVVSITDNYEVALTTAKNDSSNVTIYKLLEVAKVTSERKVSILRPKRKR